jgi:hypothetical protein
VHPFNIWNEKPTDVTISILFIYRRISTCFGPTGPTSGEFTQLFTQPLVQRLYRSGRVLCMLWLVFVTVSHQDQPQHQSTRPERYSHWTNGCVNSCVNSPEDGPVGPKHVEIRRYMNKIVIVTSVGFSFRMFERQVRNKRLYEVRIHWRYTSGLKSTYMQYNGTVFEWLLSFEWRNAHLIAALYSYERERKAVPLGQSSVWGPRSFPLKMTKLYNSYPYSGFVCHCAAGIYHMSEYVTVVKAVLQACTRRKKYRIARLCTAYKRT